MLTLDSRTQTFIYPLTDTLSLHAPRELSSDDVAEIKRDATNRNFLVPNQVVIWNHFTKCIIQRNHSQVGG